MKYMGSKRWMLGNGLGELLDERAPRARRFVDLFSGSGAVAEFVARRHKVRVVAADLQDYSRILAGAILHRTHSFDFELVWERWSVEAEELVAKVSDIPDTSRLTQEIVREARAWSQSRRGRPITQAYGGHYFSPLQSVWFDALRKTLPAIEPMRTVALAALIETASNCAAAPGHTAQPFQPTRTAKKFIHAAWQKSVSDRTREALKKLSNKYAQTEGIALVADAELMAKQLLPGDLVFLDPPYSGVHYSRFYHVLETVAAGKCGKVTGIGRYPATELRPKSQFSTKSHSLDALQGLLKIIAEQGADAIFTFPSHTCSNGLSGAIVSSAAKQYFRVCKQTVTSKFSTLGGTSGESKSGSERAARQHAKELILQLTPKAALGLGKQNWS